MKRLFALFLLFCLLFCGCGSKTETPLPPTATEPIPETEEPTQATVPETEPPVPVFDPYEIIDTMTTQELVGQMFLARCPDNETAVTAVEEYQFGGYVLFGRDFSENTPEGVRQTIVQYQEASKIPMLIAVDEEGGTVTRVSSYDQYREYKFPSPRVSYSEGGLDLVLENEKEKCLLLSGLGINVNLAPVCDITTDSASFMYKRSLGLSAEATGTVIAAMITTMSENNVGAVMKHFPGYGNNTDTHNGIAVDSRALEDLEQNDLIPFQYGIDAGGNAIMVSHIIVESLDPELPASLSSKVISYLREAMGFNGVVTTDDLKMEAIADLYDVGQAAVMAVQAGVDLLCSSNYSTQYSAVLEAVNNGSITLDRIKDSVCRILIWKHELGLL